MAVAKKTVAIIPPQVKYDKHVRVEQKKLRVAAYCRVSTLLEQQEGSYEAQVDYYTEKVNSNPNWKCAGIFADDGKSATQTKKRDDFNAMIDACMAGKVDLVLTKSVSRFARNTVDALQYIRKLKEKNIPVIFEKEGVNTMESGGELLITILSSQAQEESRNISENTRWGLTRRFENGIISVNHKKFLGYTKDEDGNLVVVPEEAVIVKRIFREYLEGSSILQIAKGLEADGIITVTGLDHWHPGTINNMLSNEKFCGDVCMQKTYTIDFLTKKKVKNEGYAPQYYIEDNHEAIIPKELFHQVQVEKARRASLNKAAVTRKTNKAKKEKSKYSSKYVLTELMVCAECGHAYRRQTWSKYGKKSAVWRCEDRLKNGTSSKCKNSPTLKEEQLHDAIMNAINDVVENGGDFIEAFRENVIRVIGNYSTEGITTEYDDQIDVLQKQMLKLIEDNAKQGAVSEDFDEAYRYISEQINELKKTKIKLVQAQKQAENYKQRVEALDKAMTTVNPKVQEFDQELVKRLIQSIRVHKGMKIEIQFHSGIVMLQEVDYYED
ncbi:MAG: recombinase family protein [Sedimentibacter saalensis]|uniref:recombinase family protein n=1 Tax=Sedimentibacter saalensis TaxID=130788 RepID=UPI002B20D662|nr:recombinase family protein [Sedimentibacter saalensis]MEA5094962.1 recombinase family protein [Sedimentibacter saalensis]